MNPTIILGIVIGVVVLALIGLVLYLVLGRRQSVVEERLGQFTQAGQAVAPVKEEEGPRPSAITEGLNRALAGRSFADGIQRELAQADMKLTLAEYFALHIILMFGLFVAMWFIGKSVVWGVLGGVAALFIPRFYVGSQQKGRLKKFDSQLGDMLNLIVNGLRAGYSVMQALEAVSRELPPPISAEFRRVVQEMQLGLAQEQALANLLRRMPSKDLDFVVTAMNVQREVGGNLAEILDNITFTIRERVRIKGEIETLTAQGMMTGYVISLLPIGLGLFLSLINPQYMGQLWERGRFFFCGIGMIATVFLMIGIGFAIIMKIVNIEV